MKDSAHTRRYALLEAPSTFGLRSAGVEQLPAALLRHGVAERLHARHHGRVMPETARSSERDPQTQTMNAQGIAIYTHKLADAVGVLLDEGEFPVVLGGDCTIVLGPALALRRRGRTGS